MWSREEHCAVLNHSVMSNSLWSQTSGVCSLSGTSVLGILQARILEWVAIPFFRGTFLTQGSNPGLLHCRKILYCLSYQESPRILDWVAYPFSRGSPWPKDQTRVSCIAAGFFTSWAVREAQREYYLMAIRYPALCLLSLRNMSMTKTASMYLFITTT